MSFTKSVIASFVVGLSIQVSAGVVDIHDNQLFIDGQAQPQIFGGEIQYFRLRGGGGRNIPRSEVIALWNKVLDRAVEAHMNAISFYIPWDFHEYAEGKFDFDGTVDEDGDGNPDYPSRDIHTFIKMVLDHGIHRILVRPGPYVNAEWGFVGFGAVPLWFHEKYPDSHCVNPAGLRSNLYNYRDPHYLDYSKKWLRTVYAEVIKPYVGVGQPMSFLQIDNETNFMWSSLYRHDFGEISKRAYRDFLRERYDSLATVNATHHRSWKTWEEVQPPFAARLNIPEDQDWYRFADETLHWYLHEIRATWESLGVHEPDVLFTLAESYNAADDGLLPNQALRNDRGVTGMMTVNLYPKTAGSAAESLFDQPFKSDHDVKSADSASDNYLGSKQEWVMGPEIQGGWWPGTEVSKEARQQTYLSVIGHGLKAMFIYYLNEGDNWQNDWASRQIEIRYDRVRKDPRYAGFTKENLPNEFWDELDQIVGREIFIGWNSRWMLDHGTQPAVLNFDSPIGPDGNARAPYVLVKEIGEKIIAPHGDFLAAATEITDPVCIVKDIASHVPSPVLGLKSTEVNSEWSAGLVGYLLQAGINPRILHWNWTDTADFKACRLLVYQDNGFTTPALNALFREALANGNGVLTFLEDTSRGEIFPNDASCGHADLGLPNAPLLNRCVHQNDGGSPGYFYHVKEPIYASFNSTGYARIADVPARRTAIELALRELHITPALSIVGGGDRSVVFGRLGADQLSVWATLKTGRTEATEGHIRWTQADAGKNYKVENVLAGTASEISGDALRTSGLLFHLEANGSAAYLISPIGN